MADGVTFNSTGSAPPSGTNVWTDELDIGGATHHAQIVKLADPTLNSTVMIGMTSGGLNVAVVNTTVPISGNSTSIISTASIIRVDTIAGGQSTAIISTASIIRVDTIATFPANSSLVVINAAVPQSSVTIAGGQSTAIISTASKIQAELVTGFGAGSSSPIITRGWALVGESTWATITLTSTTATELFSSGGSTRLNITDVQITNNSATNSAEVSIYDNATNGTLLYRGTFGPEGGISAVFATPRRGSSGENIVAQMLPTGSTVTISAGGFRSS